MADSNGSNRKNGRGNRAAKPVPTQTAAVIVEAAKAAPKAASEAAAKTAAATAQPVKPARKVEAAAPIKPAILNQAPAADGPKVFEAPKPADAPKAIEMPKAAAAAMPAQAPKRVTEATVAPISATAHKIEAPKVAAPASEAPARLGTVQTNYANTTRTGASIMNETFNRTQEAAQQATQATQQAAQQATEQFRGAMNDAGERSKVVMEKGARFVEEMADLTRGNIEAMVASSKTAAKYVETLTQGAADYNRRSFEQASATLRSFAEVKSPTDFFRLQSDFARGAFDQMVSESARVSETMVKMTGEVAQPITSRYSVAAERLKTVAA